jgi:hypothetical protein
MGFPAMLGAPIEPVRVLAAHIVDFMSLNISTCM